MRKNRFWLLLALFWGALSLVVYRPNACTICLALLVFCACLTLRSAKALWRLGFLTLFFLAYLCFDKVGLERQRAQAAGSGSYSLVVQADDYEVESDGLVKGRGRMDSGSIVLFIYRAKSQQQLDPFLRSDGPLRLSGSGERTPVMGATNRFQFDWARLLETRHITHQLFYETAVVSREQPKGIWPRILSLIRTSHARAEDWARRLPNPLGSYTRALLLGAKADDLYQENPKIQELGLIHLFSLSGLHVSFLLGTIGRLGSRLRLFRELTSVVQAILLPVFYLFTGSPPVLVRAVVAGELRLVKENFATPIEDVVLWSWSLLLSLVVTPEILLTLGGQLSFALTLGLIEAKRLSYWQRALFLSAISFPIIVAQQYGWNCWQSFDNLLAVPVFSVVVLPAVLIGSFGSFLPVVLTAANNVVLGFDRLIFWIGSLPGYIVLGAFFWPVLVGLFALPWYCFQKTWQQKAWLIGCWGCLLLLVTLAVHLPMTGEFVTFDIGQGDAAVLIEPGHRSVTVIDTGGKVTFGRQKQFDLKEKRPAPLSAKGEAAKKLRKKEGLAQSVIVPFLHARGISQIDTLALSHQDQDHIGDARVLLESFRVKQLVMPAGMTDGPAFQKKLRPYLKKTKVIEATRDTQIPNCPFHVLHPFERGEAKNEDSLAWGGVLGGKTFFTAGDLDQAGEQRVMAAQPNFHPEVVKFGHHGSKTATCPVVFAKWQPKIGLVSAGRNSRYGHPHKETLETAKKENMIVYNTQRQGMLKYVYDKNHGHFEVTLKHDPAGPKITN